MAIFGYGRVSTADQTTLNQRQEIEKAGYAIEDGFWFSDVVSGSTKAVDRPQFRRLLERIRAGETLVVSKIDRLGRDAADVANTVKELAERKVKVVVLQLQNTELTSPAGQMMVMMLAAVAQLERDLLIERTHAGLARVRERGDKLGRPAKTTPEQQAEMMRLYAGGKGESVSALARTFKISRASVLSIVKPKEAAAAPAAQPAIDAASKARQGATKATRKRAAALPMWPSPTTHDERDVVEGNSTPKARHDAKKAAKKPAAARMDDDNDMARRTALEQEYGQHRLPM
jgi:putative DNA-invertase from lambdoid prophage Rac